MASVSAVSVTVSACPAKLTTISSATWPSSSIATAGTGRHTGLLASPHMTRAARKLKVGVTGANSDLGRLLLPRLAADPRVEELVVFDLAKPEGVKATFRR